LEKEAPGLGKRIIGEYTKGETVHAGSTPSSTWHSAGSSSSNSAFLSPWCPTGGVALLLAGGICYSVGTIFYVLKKVPYMHSIWHLWVLAGSICHFLAIILYVI